MSEDSAHVTGGAVPGGGARPQEGSTVTLPREIAVRVDSLLSALVHHHTSLEKPAERAEAEWLIAAVRYAYEHAELAAGGARRPDDWHPISTAPKDGTCILIGWFELPGQNHQEVAFWHTHKGGRWCQTHRYFTQDPNWQPTHWMPLADPPTASAEARSRSPRAPQEDDAR